MFGRPRCREWTPLSTQQLRLRSLIQIVGYNIRPPEMCRSHCSFYVTLHRTPMCAPFYTSEKISSPHPKWKEIDSELTHRMSSTNVVIRIWCHVLQQPDVTEPVQDTVVQTWGVYFSGLRYIGANLALNFTSDCFKSNTLVFQMHGGYFCSYKSLKLDIIPHENETEQCSLSSDSSGKTNLSRVTLESKFIKNHGKDSRSTSPSKYCKKFEKEYSKSHSPIEKGFRQSFPTLKSSASLNINRDYRREESVEKKAVDPNYIYEHSPTNLEEETSRGPAKNMSHEELSASNIDLSETAENYDLRNETDGVPKFRYLAINFLKSEIRPSYNSAKLQRLHLLQYSIKKRQEAVQEVKERIYQISAVNNQVWQTNESEVKHKFKSRAQRNIFSADEEDSDKSLDSSAKNGIAKDTKPVLNGPRLALKLNDLLAVKTKISPLQRAEHLRLTKHLEILRFKRIILSDERDTLLTNIRKLKKRHAKLSEENLIICSELMDSFHSLSRRNETLRETRESALAVRGLLSRSHSSLALQRAHLLEKLHEIFYIQEKDGMWTICDIELPICDDRPSPSNPIRDSVASGLVAQALCLASIILDKPIRYRITLLGSASKILDVTPDLPDPNIPMYVRGGDVTLFRYALFLLNKCIAQLLYGRGLHVSDIRPTLSNLKKLLTTPPNPTDMARLDRDPQATRSQSLRSLVASDRGKCRPFNRFKDSVDGHSPQTAMNLRRHRHSRSVGSYQDEQEISMMDASTTSIMGSEPNIFNMSPVKTDKPPLKSHNSDSEILRLTYVESKGDTDSNKVIFTLGEDTTLKGLESAQLVKISSNNGDCNVTSAINDNVKQICSEIEDFCLAKDCREIDESCNLAKPEFEDFCSAKDCTNIDESFDIAKHLEAMNDNADKEGTSVEIEDVGEMSCDKCESNIDGVCDLVCAKSELDVVVIPSAEAILDTGQSEICEEP